MLERTIVEKFSEPMAMDTYKGLRLRAAVIPPLAKAEGSPDRDFMEGNIIMSKSPKDQDFSDEANNDQDKDEYDEMELLERLETLREDMEDLGVTTLAEVIQRIEELHRRLDSK